MKTIQLSQSQQNVFEGIKAFLADETKDIYILKGYAGTGKTTLITYLGNYLYENCWNFDVLAPTGRAAKVLREKFAQAVVEYGFAQAIAEKGETIHSAIYSRQLMCKESENADVAEKTYKFFFPLNAIPTNTKTVLIIDESSMIGDILSESEFMKFGSGRLLSDILEYQRLTKIEKLIFVGDDAQLPPINDAESKALNADFFTEQGYGVMQSELTEVIRQDADSTILKNAGNIRNLLKLPANQRNRFALEIADDVRLVEGNTIARQYVEANGVPEIGKSVFVAFTNRQCFTYNQAVRDILFHSAEELSFGGNTLKKLQAGDLLLNTKNTRHTWGRAIYNGDLLKVLEVGNTIQRTVPVRIKGETSNRQVTLSFTEAVLLDDKGDTFDAMLLNNSLYEAEADISVEVARAMYIDFCIRVRNNHADIKEGSEEFKDCLLRDIYFNALHVKFGYAITCHKAQGGEWETAWVDYSGRVGLFDHALRWCYTATTRARKTIMAICPPNITPYQKLKFAAIQKVAKAPQGFLSEQLRVEEPGTENSPVGISLKIKGIKEALKGTPYVLQSFSVMGYQLRLSFTYNAEPKNYEIYFNGDGVLKRLSATGDATADNDLRNIVNHALYVHDPLPYQPSNNVFEELYSKMRAACAEADAEIINVNEDIGAYNVFYSLKTDAVFAAIKFFFGINFALSTAMPISELGAADAKLVQVINNIK